MTLLIPLGLLGLLGLAALLIIYLIRPNYQQKYVSSTYVWKLSLKYRRRRVPVSKLRNFLIILCQVLAIIACSLILAEPVIFHDSEVIADEVIVVIDASASMRTETADGGTRFDKAVSYAERETRDMYESGGVVSVIVAGQNCSIVVDRADRDTYGEDFLDDKFEAIRSEGCEYGTSDMNSALSLCEDNILVRNPNAEIYLYTDEDYVYVPDGVNLVNVSDADTEWNAAILDAYAEKLDGYYVLYVDFATYGVAQQLYVDIEVTGVPDLDSDDENATKTITPIQGEPINCDGEGVTTAMFILTDVFDTVYGSMDTSGGDTVVVTDPEFRFTAYDEIHISIGDPGDSYSLDNDFYVVGGNPTKLNVLYATGEQNKFMTSILSVLVSTYADDYDIVVNYRTVTSSNVDEYTEGYDLYIFEHVAPSEMPTDGVVFLFDPDTAPVDSGFYIDGTYEDLDNYDVYLAEDSPNHPLMRNITAGNIQLTKSQRIVLADDRYETLMSFESNGEIYPAVFAKDDGASKVVVVSFSLHYSNFALDVEFPLFMNNVFTYFFPTVVSSHIYEVYSAVDIDIMGEYLRVFYGGGNIYTFSKDADSADYSEFPVSIYAVEPGVYEFIQTSYYDPDRTIVDYIYVRVPSDESDIFAVGDALMNPYTYEDTSQSYTDLLLYLAIVLVALLFIEWILHTVEGL